MKTRTITLPEPLATQLRLASAYLGVPAIDIIRAGVSLKLGELALENPFLATVFESIN